MYLNESFKKVLGETFLTSIQGGTGFVYFLSSSGIQSWIV